VPKTCSDTADTGAHGTSNEDSLFMHTMRRAWTHVAPDSANPTTTTVHSRNLARPLLEHPRSTRPTPATPVEMAPTAFRCRPAFAAAQKRSQGDRQTYTGLQYTHTQKHPHSHTHSQTHTARHTQTHVQTHAQTHVHTRAPTATRPHGQGACMQQDGFTGTCSSPTG
jgi:hypothetical protein